jgi:8-oxo-dGTP diphosphatase
METKWHLRTRAVIYQDGRFLVVRPKNPTHTFLIGGHVEIGESITTALEREVMEESGRKCEIKEYLGAIENAWIQDGVRQWEITHFFHVIIPDLEDRPDILPAEEGFDFTWITPDDFENLNFFPIPLRDFMKNWAGGDKKIWWGSTME